MVTGLVDRRNMLPGVVGAGVLLSVAVLVKASQSDPRITLVCAGLVATMLAGTLLKPRTLVTVLIIVSAMTYFRLPLGNLNLRLDTALVPACILSCIVHGHVSDFTRQFRRQEVILLAVYLVLNYAASIAFSPQRAVSLNICIWLTLNLVIVALALAVFEDDRKALFRRMYVGAFIVVATGVGGWVLAAVTGNTIGATFDPDQGLRASGVSFEPNILAGTAAMWTLILLTRQRQLRKGEWLFVALAVAAIPLSSTRAAFVALAAGLSLFALRMGARVVRLLPVALAGGVALLVAKLAVPGTFASITNKFADLSFTNQASSYRFDSWHLAFQQMSRTDWLTGKGTNSFGQRNFDPTHPGEQLPYYLGNLPLATVYDVGLAGAAVLVVVAVLLARRGGNAARHPARRVAVLVTFLLLSIATSPFFFSASWLFIALALARSKVAEPRLVAPVLPTAGPVAPPLAEPVSSSSEVMAHAHIRGAAARGTASFVYDFESTIFFGAFGLSPLPGVMIIVAEGGHKICE